MSTRSSLARSIPVVARAVTNVYLMSGLVLLTLFAFYRFYGFLGIIVLTAHPVFLVMLGWTLFLIFINRIRPIMNRLWKRFTRAFIRWIKKALMPAKKGIKAIKKGIATKKRR